MVREDFRTLRDALADATAAQKAEAARLVFDCWDVNKHHRQAHVLLDAMEVSWPDLIGEWAKDDFENVFRRAEEWEGFGENLLRVALVRSIAQRSPLDAATFMGDRLNSMSKQYYYYVTTQGLVPCLTELPMSDIMPTLAAMASGHLPMDTSRWVDAANILLRGESPWKSPDLDTDWQFLLSKKPGVLRDILIGVVLERKLISDLPAAIKLDLTQSRARFEYVKYRLREGFPLDHQLFLKQLGEGDSFLMDCWVHRLIGFSKRANDLDKTRQWSDWAETILATPTNKKRDAALAQFTRLRLKYDEFPARQWSATIQDASLKAITEREVKVSEIIHQASENWSKAFAAACALKSLPHRWRALLGVFNAAVSVDPEEVESRAKSIASTHEQVELLLDSWTEGRIAATLKAQRYSDVIPMVLTLRDLETRTQQFEAQCFVGRFGGFGKVRQYIKDANIDEREKKAFLDAAAMDQADGLLDGFHIPEEQGGTKPALEAASLIENPRLRFIHQRAVVHAAVMEDLSEARHNIEITTLDEVSRDRLIKECDRLSRWHRYEPKKN